MTYNWRLLPFVFIIALPIASCVTITRDSPVLSLEIQKERENSQVRVLVVNNSDQDQCVMSEIMLNPGSAATNVQIEIQGERVASRPEGFIAPQVEGYHRLEPLGDISFLVNIAGRFQIDDDKLEDYKYWKIKVGILSKNCSDVTFQSSVMNWSRWTLVSK